MKTAEARLIANDSTLYTCLENAIKHGFKENFRVINKGLFIEGKQQNYAPDQVKITNFYRFEGFNDPDDSSIIYLIQTSDGKKGALVDAYGVYADTDISNFIKQVKNYHK